MPIRLATAILLALSGISAAAGAQSTAETPVNTDQPDAFAPDLDLIRRAAASRILGPADDSASVTILEFFDYACSTCRQFHQERGDSLYALVGPDVSLRFHSYPIPRLLWGYPLAEAALCAGGAGGATAYRGMHDRLLRDAQDWQDGAMPQERIAGWAADLDLDADRFTRCMERDLPSTLVFADARLAARFGVAGTPTFVFVPRGAQEPEDVRMFYGNQPMSRFREAIEWARSRAR